MSTESNIAATISGGIGIATIANYREELTIIFGFIALVLSILTFCINWYYQSQRNTRETIVFEERRQGLKKDTGERRRADDEHVDG